MTTSLDAPVAATALDLSGRTALVTGAADGIGLACATRLAGAGASVVLADLDERGAVEAAERLGGVAVATDLVAFLCSPSASLVTGASVALDGGWTAG